MIIITGGGDGTSLRDATDALRSQLHVELKSSTYF